MAMEVILLEKIRGLGDIGDKLRVRSGYARNFLIPQKKAAFATPENIEYFETKKEELLKKAKKDLSDAEQLAAKINDLNVEIIVITSEQGKLYGSISVSEIKKALNEKGFDIAKRQIILPTGPIYEVGDYKIEIHVHPDVVASLQVKVSSKK